ncbi:MAG: hypothetical protein OWR52_03685 [Acidibacillus sp.]|nr:hypothetical protein [Acidibacillus sp.]
MAFVRWRGETAQILASVWQDGKSKQVRVCSLPPSQRTITLGLKEIVAKEVPDVAIDWDAIQTELDAGPQGGDYMRIAVQLSMWAMELDTPLEDRQKMREVSDMLMAYALKRD